VFFDAVRDTGRQSVPDGPHSDREGAVTDHVMLSSQKLSLKHSKQSPSADVHYTPELIPNHEGLASIMYEHRQRVTVFSLLAEISCHGTAKLQWTGSVDY